MNERESRSFHLPAGDPVWPHQPAHKLHQPARQPTGAAVRQGRTPAREDFFRPFVVSPVDLKAARVRRQRICAHRLAGWRYFSAHADRQVPRGSRRKTSRHAPAWRGSDHAMIGRLLRHIQSRPEIPGMKDGSRDLHPLWARHQRALRVFNEIAGGGSAW